MIYAEINQDCNEKEIGHRMPERRLYMGKEMIVDTEYAGYVFVGWAAGRFKTVIWYKKSRHLQLTEKE